MTTGSAAAAYGSGAGEAVARTYRFELLTVTFVRAGALANLLAGAVGLWLKYASDPKYHGDWAFATLCLILLVESVLLVGACWRVGRVRPGLVAVDVVFCAVALNINTWASTTGWMSPDSFLVFTYSLPVSLVIGVVFHRLAPATVMTAVLVLGYVTAATVASRSPTINAAWNTVFNAISYLVIAVIAWLVAGELHRMAGQLDAARAEAVRQADNASRARERANQILTLHNRPLQALETLASGGYINDLEIQRLITAEAAYLRALVESPDPEGQTGNLLSALRALIEQQARQGLSVTLRAASLAADSPHRLLPPDVTQALLDAVSETLTNVGKHGNVDRAEIRAVAAADSVTLTVVDHGRAFDPPAGLSSSIRTRIDAVGGSVDIESTPGEGTRVQLSIPVVPVTDSATD